MKMYKFIGLFVFLIGFCNAQKLPVQVYYESLCEDSQAFVTRVLYPALKRGLKDYVEIQWIPYGKSTMETRGSDVLFQCHHGQNECYGNKIHACAIEHIEVNSYQTDHTKETMILEYINCLMKAGKNFADNVYPGERCAREVQAPNWPQIAECANSTEGSQLLKRYGDLTNELKPPLTSVPLITFRYQQNPDAQEISLYDFTRAACNQMSQPKPQICSPTSMAGVISANSLFTQLFIAILTVISIKFFA